MGAFCFFRIANQHTLGTLFRRDLTATEHRTRHREMIGEMAVANLTGAGSCALGKMEQPVGTLTVSSVPSVNHFWTCLMLSQYRRAEEAPAPGSQ